MIPNFVTALVPWVAIAGFFGVLLRVRVTGDPALWTRIKDLEEKLDRQGAEFAEKLEKAIAAERADCDRRIEELQGEIRQLQQRQLSATNLSPTGLEVPLQRVYPPVRGVDKDAGLLRLLRNTPGTLPHEDRRKI